MGADFDNIPILEGWVNLTEASEMLGITRQHAYKKARLANERKANGWKTIHRVGTKPMYVVSIQEIEEILTAKQSQTTDLAKGTLAPEDRKEWLKNHNQNPDEWTDQDILVAMGSGLH